jgi:hypothetical protein
MEVLDIGSLSTYPLLGIEVQILDLAMFKKGGKSDTIIGNVRLLSNHNNIVLASLCILFDNFLTIRWYR